MSEDLADKKCVPCKGGIPPMSPGAVYGMLATLEGWQLEDNKKLFKSYRFEDFMGPVGFVNEIVKVAEEEGHHPDLYVRWGEVRAYIWTHKIDGLTESDFFIAAKIDRVFNRLAAQQSQTHNK